MARSYTGCSGRFVFQFQSVRFVRSQALVVCLLLLGLAVPAFADTVRGRVVDPQSRPVADARVLILRGQTVVATVTTAADGTFGPVTLAPGKYDLSVATPGLNAAPKPLTIAADSALNIEVALTLAARSESVLVSASQVDSALSRSSDSVTVINRADLEAHQITTVADSLRMVQGFGVVQSGGRGAVTSFFPRGGESDYTLVLVDGIPQNAFGGGFDAAHLGTADIDRIEVVRGPQSALYGGGAIGGLVQVITRQGGPTRVDGRVQGGGYGTWDAGVSTSGSSGAWNWGASFAGISTDGDTRFRDNLGEPVSNADYERLDGSAGLGWSDGQNRLVRFDVRGGRNEGGLPGPYGSDPLNLYGGVDTISRGTNTLGEFGASAHFGSAARIRHNANATYGNLKGTFVSPSFFDPTVADAPTHDQTRRFSGRYQVDLDRRMVGVSGGAEYIHERADNTFVTGPDFEDKLPIDRNITGLFVEARPALGDRAFITAGLRTERIARQALEGDGSSFGRPTDLETDVVWSVNPKVSAAWFLRPAGSGTGAGAGWTKLHGGAGTGIKPPTTFEIGFTNNPNLKPERSKSFDVGLEQALAAGAFIADVTYFGNHYDDLIIAVPVSGAGLYRYRTDNIANARARGVELGASARLPRGLQVRGTWTWLSTEILGTDGLPTYAPSPYKVGDPLIRRPDSHATLDITWTGRRAGLFATVDGRGEMTDIEPNFGSPTFTNSGYTVADLGGSFRIGRGVEVTARINNLFDNAYEEAFGYPALGRSGMIGLRVSTGR